MKEEKKIEPMETEKEELFEIRKQNEKIVKGLHKLCRLTEANL